MAFLALHLSSNATVEKCKMMAGFEEPESKLYMYVDQWIDLLLIYL